MKKLKIAIAGVGLIGRVHVKLVSQSVECELTAIVDPSPEVAGLGAELGVEHYLSLPELLQQGDVDGVIIATPNHLHLEQAILCIEADVAVLIEKPVVVSVDEGSQLLAAAKNKHSRCLVGHHRYHSAIMAKAKEVIMNNTLGDLVAVNGSAMFFKPDDYFVQGPWRTKKGGGPILINMIHEIGNLRYLCGEIVEVQAMASHSRREFEVEDTVAINFRFDSGVLGTFLLSDIAASPRSWEQTSSENKRYPHYDDEDCYVVAGTKGSLSIPTMRLKRYGGDASWFTPFDCSQIPLTEVDPLVAQLAHFCALIRHQAEPVVSLQDGLQNLKVVEAITRATQTNSSVQVSRG